MPEMLAFTLVLVLVLEEVAVLSITITSTSTMPYIQPGNVKHQSAITATTASRDQESRTLKTQRAANGVAAKAQ
jgi:hypothetical protein